MPETQPNPEVLDQLLEQRRGRRRWPFFLALVLVVSAVAVWAGPRKAEMPTYETMPLEQRELVATVSATGRLKPTLQVEVGSEISGTVVEVLVEANDAVRAGQVLARIDTTKLEQQAERSRASWQAALAQLAQAEASLVEAEVHLERLEAVYERSEGMLPSKADLDAARASDLRARAGVESARAAVEETAAATLTYETDLEKSVIRSPIDGLVLDRDIDPGQTVAASFQSPVLFTIGQDLRTMDLTVYVSEADIGKVAAGQVATFTVDAWPNLEFGAVVKKVRFGSETVENVVSYETELEVPNEEAKLRPGMTATALITVAEREDVLVVPNAALRFTPPAVPEESGLRGGFSFLPRPPEMRRTERGEESAIYVLREGLPVRVAVEEGLTDGRWTEIQGVELEPGDAVVIDLLEEAS